MLLLVTYIDPQGNAQACIDYLEGVIENIDTSKEDIFIMGDYNIDFNNKNDKSHKIMSEFCTQLGLDTCIKSDTHFSNAKNSCIDQILTNSNFVMHAGTSNLNLSDHQLIYVIRKKNRTINKKNNFIRRSYRNYNKQVFQHLLQTHNWENILNDNCPNSI